MSRSGSKVATCFTTSACGKPRSLFPVKAATTVRAFDRGSRRMVPSNVAGAVCPFVSRDAYETRYSWSLASSQFVRRKVAVRASGSMLARPASRHPTALPCARTESLTSCDSDGPTGAICAVSFITRRLRVYCVNRIGPKARSSWASIFEPEASHLLMRHGASWQTTPRAPRSARGSATVSSVLARSLPCMSCALSRSCQPPPDSASSICRRPIVATSPPPAFDESPMKRLPSARRPASIPFPYTASSR